MVLLRGPVSRDALRHDQVHHARASPDDEPEPKKLPKPPGATFWTPTAHSTTHAQVTPAVPNTDDAPPYPDAQRLQDQLALKAKSKAKPPMARPPTAANNDIDDELTRRAHALAYRNRYLIACVEVARPPTAANNDNDDELKRRAHALVNKNRDMIARLEVIARLREERNVVPQPPEPSPKRHKPVDTATGMRDYTEVEEDASDHDGPHYDERDRRGPAPDQSMSEYVGNAITWFENYEQHLVADKHGETVNPQDNDCARTNANHRSVSDEAEYGKEIVLCVDHRPVVHLAWSVDNEGEQQWVSSGYVGDAAETHGENSIHQGDHPGGGRTNATLAQVYLYSLTRLASKGY
jgi:hypothetical protein